MRKNVILHRQSKVLCNKTQFFLHYDLFYSIFKFTVIFVLFNAPVSPWGSFIVFIASLILSALLQKNS